jgi:MoaA/NifB/PqqE/SkfB family radical SAM enzyme
MSARKGAFGYLFRNEDGVEYCDKKSPLAEMLFRFDAYRKLSIHALRAGIPVIDLVRARFPYRLREPARPSMLSIELCNVCNLRCAYCPTHEDRRKKGYMSEEVFSRVIDGLREMGIPRVHIRGWGEPTLHPRFEEYVARLSRATRYVDIVTNAQWKDDGIARALLEAPVHRIDVSVDVGGSARYEAARVGGSHRLLLHNLGTVKALRKRSKSRSMTIVRSMFRPSQAKELEREMATMREYADAVMPAPIFRRDVGARPDGPAGDVYTLTAAQDEYPRCYFPFNELSVCHDGSVPMCDNLVLMRPASEVNMGSVVERSLKDLWSHERLKGLRSAHRLNLNQGRAICRGCPTC